LLAQDKACNILAQRVIAFDARLCHVNRRGAKTQRKYLLTGVVARRGKTYREIPEALDWRPQVN